MNAAVDVEVASAAGEPSLHMQIDALKKQAAEMRTTKAKVIKELKNAQKRKRRLQTKVRALSDQDLLAVLLMRKDAGGASSGSAAAPQAGAAEAAAAAAAGAPSA